METKIVIMSQIMNKDAIMKEAGQVIRSGGLVAFPTETVYGLGGDAWNPISAGKIYEAKGRPSDNPLIVHIADLNSLTEIVEKVNRKAEQLIQAFWPGPLTIIFQKNHLMPVEVTGGLDTIAVRMPEHELARAFIKEAGGFIAAPSANKSGRPSPTLAKYVVEDLAGKIDMILDGGMVGIGLESTIVDVTNDIPEILRPGSITKRMLEEVIGEVVYDPTILSMQEEGVPKAPGMKYKHYAPRGELTIIQGPPNLVSRRINELSDVLLKCGERVGIIATDETVQEYRATIIKSVGSRQDEDSIARRLYQILREFDNEKISYIYSESFESDRIGQAIMNRLLKAAAYQIENVERE
ncbi:MAG: L-threonylcarbamoyladenylate synthase [Eubacteriales bacterium]